MAKQPTDGQLERALVKLKFSRVAEAQSAKNGRVNTPAADKMAVGLSMPNAAAAFRPRFNVDALPPRDDTALNSNV